MYGEDRICISILGFNLDEHPEYHKVYRLRDETGYEFSDMLEIHVIELNKRLSGTGRMDDCLIADRRLEDLEKSVKDKEYREQLYREYGINSES